MEKFTPNASWRRGTPLYKSDNRHSVPISEPELIAPFDIQEKTAWRYTHFVVHTMANIKNFFGFGKDFRLKKLSRDFLSVFGGFGISDNVFQRKCVYLHFIQNKGNE